MKRIIFAVATGLILTSQAWAAHHEHKHGHHKSAHMPMHWGKAVIEATTGNATTGWVHFAPQAKQLHIWGEIRGLTPGQHGFHIHQYGDCSSGDGKSAGGHFAPGKTPHGAPTAGKGKHHPGDLGNITANAQGVAKIDLKVPFLSVHGKHSVIGRAVVIHAGADDLKSQPSGAAGSRVGCGVVGIIKKTSK